jgi:exonuclease III
MQLISWNMAGAGFHSATSHDDAWRWLTTEADFDVALLQESTPPPWVLEEFPVVIHNPKYLQTGKRWGNSIICRQDNYREFKFDSDHQWLERIGGAVTVAQPNDPDGIWLINMHSNASPVPPELFMALQGLSVTHCHPKKIWEVEVATHFLSPILEGKRFIFGGDLNSGYLFDTVYRYDNNKILFENMRQQGFIDLRLAHSVVEQQTYFKDNKGPYQLDQVFGDARTAARTTQWEVLSHVARDLELSDHAPVIVEINSG